MKRYRGSPMATATAAAGSIYGPGLSRGGGRFGGAGPRVHAPQYDYDEPVGIPMGMPPIGIDNVGPVPAGITTAMLEDIYGPPPPLAIPVELLYSETAEERENEYAPEMMHLLDGLGLPPLVQYHLEDLLFRDLCQLEDISGSVLEEFVSIPERISLDVIKEFATVDRNRTPIRNINSFLNGIIKKFVKTERDKGSFNEVIEPQTSLAMRYSLQSFNPAKSYLAYMDAFQGGPGGVAQQRGPPGGRGFADVSMGQRKRPVQDVSFYAGPAMGRGFVHGHGGIPMPGPGLGPGGIPIGFGYDDPRHIMPLPFEPFGQEDILQVVMFEWNRYIEIGRIREDDLKYRNLLELVELFPNSAVESLHEFASKDLTQISNKPAYLKGIAKNFSNYSAEKHGGGGGRKFNKW